MSVAYRHEGDVQVADSDGFLEACVHVFGAEVRMSDLAVSVAALLIAEACNVGLTPVTDPGRETLTRCGLSHVGQNYLRAETHAAANARLIEALVARRPSSAWPWPRSSPSRKAPGYSWNPCPPSPSARGNAGAGCFRLHEMWHVADHGEAVGRGLRVACTAVATMRAYSVAPGGRGCTPSSQSRPVRCSMVANQLASTTL